MNIGFSVIFRTDAKSEEVAKFICDGCGINLRKNGESYEANVCGISAFLHENSGSITFGIISYVGLHFSSQT
jgi:hypothetical protein